MHAIDLIFAPAREWADMVISEMENFPKGKFDDLCDASCQGINFLRAAGLAQNDSEQFIEKNRAVQHRRRPSSIYRV